MSDNEKRRQELKKSLEAVAILCEAMGDSLGYRPVFKGAAKRIRALGKRPRKLLPEDQEHGA